MSKETIKAYKKRRYIRLLDRMDADDDEGQWITTENGHHVHINAEGEPDVGNTHVIAAMSGGKTGPKQLDTAKKLKGIQQLRFKAMMKAKMYDAAGNKKDAAAARDYANGFKKVVDDELASIKKNLGEEAFRDIEKQLGEDTAAFHEKYGGEKGLAKWQAEHKKSSSGIDNQNVSRLVGGMSDTLFGESKSGEPNFAKLKMNVWGAEKLLQKAEKKYRELQDAIDNTDISKYEGTREEPFVKEWYDGRLAKLAKAKKEYEKAQATYEQDKKAWDDAVKASKASKVPYGEEFVVLANPHSYGGGHRAHCEIVKDLPKKESKWSRGYSKLGTYDHKGVTYEVFHDEDDHSGSADRYFALPKGDEPRPNRIYHEGSLMADKNNKKG